MHFNKVYRPIPIKEIIQGSFITLNYFYVFTIFFSISDLLDVFSIDLFLLVNQFLTRNFYLFIFFALICSIGTSIIKQMFSFYKFYLYYFDDYIEISNGILKI